MSIEKQEIVGVDDLKGEKYSDVLDEILARDDRIYKAMESVESRYPDVFDEKLDGDTLVKATIGNYSITNLNDSDFSGKDQFVIEQVSEEQSFSGIESGLSNSFEKTLTHYETSTGNQVDSQAGMDFLSSFKLERRERTLGEIQENTDKSRNLSESFENLFNHSYQSTI